MAEAIAILVLFNIIFFKKLILNPFLNCTSELASTYFPQWRDYKFFDTNYYFYPLGIPFLCMFYPFHWITHKISKKMSLDYAFCVMHYGIIAHYILSSVLAFIMFRQWYVDGYALIGAISYSYGAYNIKPNNPTIAFTIAWIPAMFIQGWVGAVGLGMCLLAGYYPLLIFMVPLALWNNPICALGVIIGAIQVCPFCIYLLRSIRTCVHTRSKAGKASIFSLLNAITGTIPNRSISGVGYPEVVTYCGILAIPCAFFAHSSMWVILALSIVMMFGVNLPFSRNPARACFLFQFALVWLMVNGLSNLAIDWRIALLVQGFSLMANRDLFPVFPFSEQWRKPSYWFESKFVNEIKSLVKDRIISGLPFPHFTGYINDFKVLPYTGGFAIAKFAKEYDYIQGVHDYFEHFDDYEKAESFGIEFAYSRKELKWKKTKIKNLWQREAT